MEKFDYPRQGPLALKRSAGAGIRVFMPMIGMLVGLIFGIIIALPALRLDGFYYGLLTLGLNELCRVFITTSKQFGAASGGLYGADTFLNENWAPMTQTLVQLSLIHI